LAETRGTVLIVDDEDSVRQVASEILTHLGYTVQAARSCDEAVRILRDGTRPDVVLLDLIMPGMNGFQTLRAIRGMEPDLPVLISTGYADRTAAETLLSEGAAGFVNKPYHMDTLDKAIVKVRLASKRPA
jgi:CheY-like chemotaxis protein